MHPTLSFTTAPNAARTGPRLRLMAVLLLHDNLRILQSGQISLAPPDFGAGASRSDRVPSAQSDKVVYRNKGEQDRERQPADHWQLHAAISSFTFRLRLLLEVADICSFD